MTTKIWVLVTKVCTFLNTHQTVHVKSVHFAICNLTLIGRGVNSRSKNDFLISGLGPGRLESSLAENAKREKRNTFPGEKTGRI